MVKILGARGEKHGNDTRKGFGAPILYHFLSFYRDVNVFPRADAVSQRHCREQNDASIRLFCKIFHFGYLNQSLYNFVV